MLNLQYTNQFKKDFKLAKKRGCNISEFETVLRLLQNQQPLPEKYKDHQLIRNWKSHRELHITPDWLLIYRMIGLIESGKAKPSLDMLLKIANSLDINPADLFLRGASISTTQLKSELESAFFQNLKNIIEIFGN